MSIASCGCTGQFVSKLVGNPGFLSWPMPQPLSKTMSCLVVSKMKKHLSLLMGKPTICICENKDADQLRGNREADQRLCFRYSDSTVPLLLKSKVSSSMCLYRLACVGPVWKPHCWFSHEMAHFYLPKISSVKVK